MSFECIESFDNDENRLSINPSIESSPVAETNSQDASTECNDEGAVVSRQDTDIYSQSEKDVIWNGTIESSNDNESHEEFSDSELGGEDNINHTIKPFSKSVDTVDHIESMASEVTEVLGHLSPRNSMPHPEKNMLSQKKNNFPDEIISPESGVLSTVSDQSRTNHKSNISTSYSHRVPRILVNRQRVPGGAAAKLIGLKRDDDYQFVNDGDDALVVIAPVDELIKSRDMAKAEFSVGSTENKRYHAPVREENDDDVPLPNVGSLPRILDRDEVFHENAAAAIFSILTPSNKSNNAPEIVDILSARSSDIHLSPSTKKKGQAKEGFPSPFLRPSMKPNVATVKSFGSDPNCAVEDAIETMTSTGKNPLVQHLLTKKTERHLAAIKNRMKDPTKNLTELMEAIASPQNGLFDRHYMVRRKNACGALKVLTANASHRVNICWTVGVLPALASVLEDSGPDTLEDKFPNASIRREYFEARKRALSALMYLALPQNNKLPIFHCPHLVASLVRVIEQDDGEARRSCCTVLAHLSKSKENRLIMAQVPGLLDAVTTVIEPNDHYTGSDEDFMSSHSVESETSDVDVYDQLLNDEIEMSISEKSPQQTMSKERVTSEDVEELSARYDEDPDPFLHGARQNVFALLSHLVKEKDNTYILARHTYLVSTLVAITKLQESSSQDFGLKLLANLSRHRSNSKIMVFKMKDVVPALVFATNSNNEVSRKYACYTLQNFSQDKPCRQQLASIENLLIAVCRCIRDATDPDEKLAALHTLKNLTDEPANLIPMTNTPECFATLIQVAHASDDSITDMMQYVGCDALATLSHWFRSIATSGHRIGTDQRNTPESVLVKDQLFVPSQRVLAWEPWQ